MRYNSAYAFHLDLGMKIKPSMTFDYNGDFEKQKSQIKQKLLQILSMPEKQTNPVASIISESTQDARFDEISFEFESEPDFFVPARLLLPKNSKGKLPVVICLQGHTPGMFVSLGQDAEGNAVEVEGDRDFAIQCVKRGYATVIVEQRGFGKLAPKETKVDQCHYQALQALLIGRTILGERCFDISQLICALESFDKIDLNRIGIMGNSGGGTTSYFAAAIEPRITAVMPSCAFCGYKDAHLSYYHCACSFLPGLIKYMDMPDIGILIAPRPLIIVAGKQDPLANLTGVKHGFEVIRKIYDKSGAPDNCKLVVGDGGHRFYADIGWQAFSSMFDN
ncbi:MAG: alpha/beta hydrolase family protein [Eubacteriales bacterium]|nr:alpha/beta hydrolase family protein [Eubacteriales bacterium]